MEVVLWIKFTSAIQAVKGARMRIINKRPPLLGCSPELIVEARLTNPARIQFVDGGELLLASAKLRYEIKIDEPK